MAETIKITDQRNNRKPFGDLESMTSFVDGPKICIKIDDKRAFILQTREITKYYREDSMVVPVNIEVKKLEKMQPEKFRWIGRNPFTKEGLEGAFIKIDNGHAIQILERDGGNIIYEELWSFEGKTRVCPVALDIKVLD